MDFLSNLKYLRQKEKQTDQIKLNFYSLPVTLGNKLSRIIKKVAKGVRPWELTCREAQNSCWRHWSSRENSDLRVNNLGLDINAGLRIRIRITSQDIYTWLQ